MGVQGAVEVAEEVPQTVLPGKEDEKRERRRDDGWDRKIFGWVTDLATAAREALQLDEEQSVQGVPGTVGGAKPQPRMACVVLSFNILLKRTEDDQRLGFGWYEEGFRSRKERLLEKLQPGSLADLWNQEQIELGQPDMCVKALDRLVSVNGRVSPDEMTVELQCKEVDLKFHRKVFRAVDPAPVEPAATSSAEVSLVRVQNSVPPAEAPTESEGAAAESQGLPKPQAEVVKEAAAEVVAPHSVVVQVLSLIEGSVRISWLFDWSRAPELDAPRGFDVVAQQVDGDGHERTTPCTRPPLKLDLPVGHRYSLKVRATLKDSSTQWASESALAAADLRALRARCNTAEDLSAGSGEIAARLGAFLAKRPSAPPAIMPAAVPKELPRSRLTAEAQVETKVAPNPLMTAQPRVVAGGADAGTEKREISERLARRGQVVEMSMERIPSHDDNGELRRLSHALSSLQRTAQIESCPASPTMQHLAEAFGTLDRVVAPVPEFHLNERDVEINQCQNVVRASEFPTLTGGSSASDAGCAFGAPSVPGTRTTLAMNLTAAIAAKASAVTERASSQKQVVEKVLPRTEHAPFQPPREEKIPPSASNSASAEHATHLAQVEAELPKCPTFRLHVQLADGQVKDLEFALSDDLQACVSAFVQACHLRELFQEPLLGHMELMVHMDRRDDTVDIVDLL